MLKSLTLGGHMGVFGWEGHDVQIGNHVMLKPHY
jgi:hypothetical protein